ncbi:MAG: hypothetical protein ACLQPD_22870 [Desulfomonilaceae bacterium]
MKRKPDPELIDKENPEWTEEDFRPAKPTAEALREIVGRKTAARMLRPRGRPKAIMKDNLEHKAQTRGARDNDPIPRRREPV